MSGSRTGAVLLLLVAGVAAQPAAEPTASEVAVWRGWIAETLHGDFARTIGQYETAATDEDGGVARIRALLYLYELHTFLGNDAERDRVRAVLEELSGRARLPELPAAATVLGEALRAGDTGRLAELRRAVGEQLPPRPSFRGRPRETVGEPAAETAALRLSVPVTAPRSPLLRARVVELGELRLSGRHTLADLIEADLVARLRPDPELLAPPRPLPAGGSALRAAAEAALAGVDALLERAAHPDERRVLERFRTRAGTALSEERTAEAARLLLEHLPWRLPGE